MIGHITGNWLRKWSSNIEAGTRVCRVERFLSDRGYMLAKHSPVYVNTDRVILDDEMLQTTDEKSILDRVADKIRKTDFSCRSGNLNRLIWDVRNIKPKRNRVTYPNLSWDDFYKPGEIVVHYETDRVAGEGYSFVDLAVRTVLPYSSPSLDNCHERERVLFDWGNTSKLIVEAHTTDDEFGKEILRIARKK